MDKKKLKDLKPGDLSFQELVSLKARIIAKRPKLSRKLKRDADSLVVTIDAELEEMGFGKENELKQSIKQKPGRDERKN